MIAAEAREREFLAHVLPSYEAEGFTVFLNPLPTLLPPSMRRYHPDAIAIKGDKKIAIEIKQDVETSRRALDQIRALFDKNPDWELRVYYLPDFQREEPIRAQNDTAVNAAIEEASELSQQGHLKAALMLAWATLEAIGRTLLPDQLARPQPALRLVEVLSTEGIVTPGEADILRGAIGLRNAAVHGELDLPITSKQVGDLIQTVRSVAAAVLGRTSK